MADIVKKNGREQQSLRGLGTSPSVEWSPLRVMSDWLRRDPFREMAPLLPSFPVFERLEWNPSFDVTEDKDSYLFKADVPGVKKEDLEISTTGNRLQISGKREAEKETKSETVYTYERQHGSSQICAHHDRRCSDFRRELPELRPPPWRPA